jgi:hypothetical protein
MASLRATRRARVAPQTQTIERREKPRGEALRLAGRRAHVERRVRFLEREESRLALAGNYDEARETANERRYWEFIRALLAAPAAPRAPDALVH